MLKLGASFLTFAYAEHQDLGQLSSKLKFTLLVVYACSVLPVKTIENIITCTSETSISTTINKRISG